MTFDDRSLAWQSNDWDSGEGGRKREQHVSANLTISLASFNDLQCTEIFQCGILERE